MAMLILVVILIGVPLGLLSEALFLHLTTKFFKIENARYKTALKVSIYFMLIATVLALIIGALFSVVNIKFLGNIVAVIAGFFVANFLYKKYYLTDTKQNIKIYIVKMLISGVVYFAISLLVVIPIRMFIVQPFTVQGSAMDPNYKDGTYMLIKEFDKDYKKGEVIVFKYPKDEKQFFIKRIIGMPGEKIEIKQGAVYINGKVLDESAYLSKNVITNGEINLALGNDEYFVMGDNREFSHDSRTWGVLKKNLIVGKYWTTWALFSKK